MRFVLMADLHGLFETVVDGEIQALSVPDGDAVILAGDATNVGRLDEVGRFLAWFAMLPHQHKIFCAGNHDFLAQQEPRFFREMVAEYPSLTYLQDSGTVINGFKVWGSPWSTIFMDWAFMLTEEQLAEKWALIPDDTQVLITHSPPYGFLDALGTQHLGSKSLAQRVNELDKLKLSVFGHIHCRYGAIRHPQALKKLFVNASICTESYEPINPIRVVDL